MSKDIKPIDGHSLDITKHNIEQLKRLFPNIFTEGKIDFDALKSELGEYIESSDERYQFTWAGKEQAKRIATTPSLGTLRPVPEESVEWDTTENLYIEGDNLEVLKLLQKSYFNKVKMIYIDPPYNIGNDYVYKDDFKDNLANYLRLTGQLDAEGNPLSTNRDSAGRYHSNWLNMMYPRLKLARNLLREDGVIFISIDDNEVHNLRKICDEIFGEENLAGVIKRRAARKTAFLSSLMTDMCDYIVIYVKSDQAAPLTDGQVSDNTRPVLNRGNKESIRILRKGAEARCADGFYKKGIYGARTIQFELLDELSIKCGKVINDVKIKAPWRINQETLDKSLYITKNFGLRRYVLPEELKKSKLLNDLHDNKEFYNEAGTEELKELLHNDVFDNPKPSQLIKFLIEAVSLNNDDLILDFFSGSSTTAQAVLNKNVKNNGSLKFIMVQIPEPTPENSEARRAGYDTIAEIGKERIRRVAAKIREEHPDAEVDLGFKVLKLDTSNIKKWQPEIETIADDLIDAVDNIHTERTPADLLYEVLLKYGLPLTLPVEEIKLGEHTAFNVAMGSLVACFDENISLETVQAIIGLSSKDTPVLRVVFRDNGFKDDVAKTNAMQRLKQAGIDDVLSI